MSVLYCSGDFLPLISRGPQRSRCQLTLSPRSPSERHGLCNGTQTGSDRPWKRKIQLGQVLTSLAEFSDPGEGASSHHATRGTATVSQSESVVHTMCRAMDRGRLAELDSTVMRGITGRSCSEERDPADLTSRYPFSSLEGTIFSAHERLPQLFQSRHHRPYPHGIVRLAEVRSVTWANSRSDALGTVTLELGAPLSPSYDEPCSPPFSGGDNSPSRPTTIQLRAGQGVKDAVLEDWFELIEECIESSKSRRAARTASINNRPNPSSQNKK
ncbi:hypothetical protein B566_EDAN015830 [Ephemera danica]|nr:hypothetical protein B566_EDAN015830 [Ephemera danica]